MTKTEKMVARIILSQKWSFLGELMDKTGKSMATIKRTVKSLEIKQIITSKKDHYGTSFFINPHSDFAKYGIE